jgi:hypothetical protein
MSSPDTLSTFGGAVYGTGSNSDQRFELVTFRNNSCVARGWSPLTTSVMLAGGAYYFNGAGSNAFTDVTASGNRLQGPFYQEGGAFAIYSNTPPYFTRVVIEPYTGRVPVNTTFQTVESMDPIYPPSPAPTQVRGVCLSTRAGMIIRALQCVILDVSCQMLMCGTRDTAGAVLDHTLSTATRHDI